MTPGSAGGGGASDEALRGGHQSPCLKLLFERLAGGGRHLVLDLGPAVGENVQFFARLSCKLYIADLYESLFGAGVRQPDSARAFQQLLERDLPSTDGEAVDVILAWDLLNYLERAHLPVLAESLAAFCHRRTQLFAMVATHKEMPARPSVFRILDAEHLAFEADRQWQRESPRYTEPDLKRGMPDFDVDVSFLLRNGLQEYILSYRPRGIRLGAPAVGPPR